MWLMLALLSTDNLVCAVSGYKKPLEPFTIVNVFGYNPQKRLCKGERKLA
jgi:hypothetical protein